MRGLYRKIAFIYLYISHFRKRHSHLLLAGFVIGFFFSLLLFKFYPLVKSILSPNVNVIGQIGSFERGQIPISIQKLISLGLTKVAEDGRVYPSLADSWQASDSGKIYFFHLKKDLLWHDGKTLTASDIKYNLKGIKITPIDNLNLKISLKEPFTPLPAVLSRPIFRQNLIGLGLYKVANIKYKGDIIFSIKLTPLNDSLPQLEYKFYPSLDEAILAFKLGEINTLVDIPTKDPFSNWKNIQIKEVTLYDRFLGLFFNMNDDALKDKEVRQGLSFATPFFADTERVYSPISPSSWAYYNRVRIYKYDPDNAQKILEKTALSTTSAEMKISTYAFYLPFAQKIADSWTKVGIKTKIKVESAFPSDYQIILMAQEIPEDPDQYQYWHSKEVATNISHYANLKVDKLLEDGRKEIDIEKRKKNYADFQRYLVDDAPVAFLFFPKVYTFERK